MKKLLSFGVILLLVTVSVLTASPLPLLLRAPQAYTVVLKLSDADLSAITSFAANNQKELISTLVNGLDIANDVLVAPGIKNKIPMPKLKVGNGFRPYSGTQEFKVKGLTYTDRFLEVKVGKRELQIDPEDYMTTYLAWVNSPGSSAGKKDIPFAQFMWDQVIKAVQREMNDETAYKGFDSSATADWGAGTVYLASAGTKVKFASATDNPNGVKDYWMVIVDTTAGQSPDTNPTKWQNVTARAVAPGIESYILAGITSTEIAPVATGVINSTLGVAITAFKKIHRAFIPAIKNFGTITSCSYTDWELLLDDLGEKYKYIKDDASKNGFIFMPETNNKNIVKPATWLGSSRRLISGPVMPGDQRHMNLFMGTDLLSDASSISVKDTELWKLNAGLKVRMGFQIQDMQSIKVGDQV
jgi:hypothetical protein